jgi:probable F420-dependent oxidoreductase
MTMHLGLLYPQQELPLDNESLDRFIENVQELGLDHICIGDHVTLPDSRIHENIPGPYDHTDPYREPFTLGGNILARSRLSIMTMLVLPQRQAPLVAKQSAELDVLSNQRLRISVGLGWNRSDYQVMGVDWATRAARLEEQIQVMRLLWSEESVTFEGRWHDIPAVGMLPRPPSGSVPIWFGTGCNPKALDRVARLGDGWYPLLMSPATYHDRPLDESPSGWNSVVEGFATIKRLAEQTGRDPSTIGLEGRIDVGDRDQKRIARHIDRWMRLGATHLTFDSREKSLNSVQGHLDSLELAVSLANNAVT